MMRVPGMYPHLSHPHLFHLLLLHPLHSSITMLFHLRTSVETWMFHLWVCLLRTIMIGSWPKKKFRKDLIWMTRVMRKKRMKMGRRMREEITIIIMSRHLHPHPQQPSVRGKEKGTKYFSCSFSSIISGYQRPKRNESH